MTPSEVIGYVPVVVGAVHALIVSWRRPWAVDLRRRILRQRSPRRVGAGTAPRAATARLVVRYEPPDGGRFTVWVIADVPAPELPREEVGPW